MCVLKRATRAILRARYACHFAGALRAPFRRRATRAQLPAHDMQYPAHAKCQLLSEKGRLAAAASSGVAAAGPVRQQASKGSGRGLQLSVVARSSAAVAPSEPPPAAAGRRAPGKRTRDTWELLDTPESEAMMESIERRVGRNVPGRRSLWPPVRPA